MLYIKKQKPSTELLDRVAEIKSTPEWRQTEDNDTTAIRQQFDMLPKDEIRKSILEEQHHLCAYCMKRIEDEPLKMSIEHWYPLSKGKEHALEYNNMIGVCKGGSNVELTDGTKRQLCCDAYKGDKEIYINPLNQEHMRQIKYTKDGKIYTLDDVLDKDINDTLRLNGIYNDDGTFKCDTSTGLVKGRRDAYEKSNTIIQYLAKKGKLTASHVSRQIQQIENAEKREEFAGVILFFLNRKRRMLEGIL